MEQRRYTQGKRLHYGYTTGSCAAAAAKGAAQMLLSGQPVQQVPLLTPKGWLLQLVLEDCSYDEEQASCEVRKEAGDDPDVTDGMLMPRCEKLRSKSPLTAGQASGG